ncbi:MAG: tRNA (guanosine(37)-N1)-methyltransferase TrmD [Rickettsiales bacterium]|jgi:tRNA (guanine37-N1)-methyltransferase|nr:tRNA (guanosine(37)-N1)-methyltransferase TrmD [Rickettsiales bacterium]
MTNFNIITLFPEFFPGINGGALAGKALSAGIWSERIVNLRDYAINDYGSVDDSPFGGGAGMVIRPDVMAAAIDGIPAESRGKIIYFSPRGKPLTQKMAREFSAAENLTLVCGRYEGLDQRAILEYDMAEVSVGDYILSGGDLAAQIFIDTIVRLLDNVVGKTDSINDESFETGLLEYPLFTRPAAWRGRNVPEVLLNGNHKAIGDWRREQARLVTMERRPDLMKAECASEKSANKKEE